MSSSSSEKMRLQRFLARAGVASRRRSEELIAAGKVKVNGKQVTELGTSVDPTVDVVEYDGNRLRLPSSSVVIMLNKPKGYLSAMEDARERTVASLIPIDDHPGLFPVGRLDKDTTGLLLFATDGELGHRLLHPSMGVTKRYEAVVEGAVTDGEAHRLSRGIELDDGMTAPARCDVIDIMEQGGRNPRSRVAIEIHEGRKRQVRRMFDAIGHPVLELKRTDFGPIGLGDLPEGTWRALTTDELDKLNTVQSKEDVR